MKITAIQLTEFCAEALTRAGLNEEDAQLAAEALVLTDSWGVHTHGTKSLLGYIKRIRGGGIRKDGRPRIERQGPAWAIVDGDAALGMVGATFAMRAAIQKARQCGIGYAGLRNSCHFGAAGVYSTLAAREGLIGLSMSNDIPTVAAPGSRGAVLGSNPFSFAVPVRNGNPVFLDIATSTVAGGKVFVAGQQGKSIPEGWLIDDRGLPTTNPTLFPHGATLTPMSGHKGYGIAFLIETLSGILTGASIGWHIGSWTFADPSLPTDHGGAFIAIDIGAISDAGAFHERLQQTIREIHDSPKADGVSRIYLPGEIEWERRERALSDGIILPPDVVERLDQVARDLDLPAHFGFDKPAAA